VIVLVLIMIKFYNGILFLVSEKADVHFINGNYQEKRRFHPEEYQQRRLSFHKLFIKFHQRLGESDSFALSSLHNCTALSQNTYRSDGRFWPVDLCCAVVRRKSASLRLVSMRSDTVLSQ
jgi:hypothetical protein